MKRSLVLIGLLVMTLMAISTASVSAQVQGCTDINGRPTPCTPTPEPGGPTADDPDGDGIVNTFDACPNEGGPSNNNGCPMGPDGDGDGTSDDRDVCPTEGGPASNNGCPETTTTGGSIPPTVTPIGPGDLTALHVIPEGTGCLVATATTQGVNLRAAPSINAAVIATLDPTKDYTATHIVQNLEGMWYHLSATDNQASGYASSSALRTNAACASVPVMLVTELPPEFNLGLPPFEENNDVRLVGEDVLPPFLRFFRHTSSNDGVNPEFEGPDDLHMCLYHPDYGTVICEENPDGTFDPAAGQTADPAEMIPPVLGVCVYNPDFGYIVCHHAVDDGNGRIGELAMVCDVATDRCTGTVVTFPAEPGADCPAPAVALLLPAVQKVRDAAARSGNNKWIEIESWSLGASQANTDPCAPIIYGLDLPIGLMGVDFGGRIGDVARTTPINRPPSMLVWNSPTLPPLPPSDLEANDDGATEGHCSGGGGITGCSVDIGPFSISIWYEDGSGFGGAACHNSSDGVQTCVP